MPPRDPYSLTRRYDGIDDGGYAIDAFRGAPFGDSRDGVMDRAQRDINRAIEPNFRGDPLAIRGQLASIGIDVDRLAAYANSVQAGNSIIADLDPTSPEARARERKLPQATNDLGKYGDLRLIGVTFAATDPVADRLVLPEMSSRRLILIIQNQGINPLYFNFDAEAWLSGLAAGMGGMLIPAGGNALFDTFVPQNDLHLSAAGLAGAAVVAYSVADI